LLLIGWSASYTYIAMERFWSDGDGEALEEVLPTRVARQRLRRQRHTSVFRR
jgi:hypothetical protein